MAAAEVSGAEIPDRSGRTRPPLAPSPISPDLLAGLVDKSLLRTLDDGRERRYGMLETIREYGLERLAEADEEAQVRRWHLAWCLDLAERAEPELIGAEQHHWFSRLAIEHDNLRVALGWAIAETTPRRPCASAERSIGSGRTRGITKRDAAGWSRRWRSLPARSRSREGMRSLASG